MFAFRREMMCLRTASSKLLREFDTNVFTHCIKGFHIDNLLRSQWQSSCRRDDLSVLAIYFQKCYPEMAYTMHKSIIAQACKTQGSISVQLYTPVIFVIKYIIRVYV